MYLEDCNAPTYECLSVYICSPRSLLSIAYNKCSGADVCKCLGVNVHRYLGVNIYKCLDVNMYRCLWVNISRCLCVNMYRCSGVRSTCLFTRLEESSLVRAGFLTAQFLQKT